MKDRASAGRVGAGEQAAWEVSLARKTTRETWVHPASTPRGAARRTSGRPASVQLAAVGENAGVEKLSGRIQGRRRVGGVRRRRAGCCCPGSWQPSRCRRAMLPRRAVRKTRPTAPRWLAQRRRRTGQRCSIRRTASSTQRTRATRRSCSRAARAWTTGHPRRFVFCVYVAGGAQVARRRCLGVSF